MPAAHQHTKVRDPTVVPMQQYRDAKEKHPGMLLLFRRGDPYELYGDDAETAARDLGLGLTQRSDEGMREMVFVAAFPQLALESHLRQLLKAGHRVAICDPGEDIPLEDTAEKTLPTLFDECEE